MKQHYYACDGPADRYGYGKTACGLLGRKTGGLIACFFEKTELNKRCKTCNRRFEKDSK